MKTYNLTIEIKADSEEEAFEQFKRGVVFSKNWRELKMQSYDFSFEEWDDGEVEDGLGEDLQAKE